MTLRFSPLTLAAAPVIMALAILGAGLSPFVHAQSPVNISATYSLNTDKTTQTAPQALQFSYPAPVRLEQVLSDTLQHLTQLPVPAIHNGTAVSNQTLYWPAASLFTRFPHPDKSAVIDALSTLIADSDTDEARVFTALKQQLSVLPIGERIFTSLDYDAVRIDASANPLVNQSVTLVLPPKPTQVLVLGAVQQPGFFPWQPRQSVDAYFDQARVASYGMTQANNSDAIVIQPDGTVETHTFAYWNHQHRDIAPGATVYLPFADLPREAASLNDEIVNLLRNRAQ
ncbi:capsule biosynthesis GfcC family protein [Photobacterium aphoticum]|uniref:capsule biosynthesis GfcC family protein n=1 Tax=Photobacterium aphoticum TaxID=754436 RepID=UPI00069E404E|nr:capsule biosynthesis GfcC family protein [Photobacterium aphoticum]PSU56673.1 polysaccharide synthesis [Photobacterium aphoticum]GHA39025.1 hypothetical protein GCM10007086_10700 [Photobacterium aphoticum]